LRASEPCKSFLVPERYLISISISLTGKAAHGAAYPDIFYHQKPVHKQSLLFNIHVDREYSSDPIYQYREKKVTASRSQVADVFFFLFHITIRRNTTILTSHRGGSGRRSPTYLLFLFHIAIRRNTAVIMSHWGGLGWGSFVDYW